MSRVGPDQIDETVRAAGRWRWGTTVVIVTVLLLGVLAWRMVPHPIGPARTFGKYEGKAVTTAEAAESEVQAALLVSRTASAGNAFGPYTALVIADAEGTLGDLQGTFDSIQPPDRRADALGRELDALLGDALEHTRDLRVAARRGERSELRAFADPLATDAQKLEDFQGRHQ